MEEWLNIPSFPGYSISNQGHIRNEDTGRIMAMLLNQRGIVNVGLTRNLTQYKRSVSRLVASAFLPKPSDPLFDTPINLDGDRFNNRVDNLMWRPRCFAIEYYHQFDPGYPDNIRVREMTTGLYFDSTLKAATKYGLIDYEVFLAAVNNNTVWPTNQRFSLL